MRKCFLSLTSSEINGVVLKQGLIEFEGLGGIGRG